VPQIRGIVLPVVLVVLVFNLILMETIIIGLVEGEEQIMKLVLVMVDLGEEVERL